ncbi:hypothetical protein KZ770_04220 [Escherichia coli]|nr:hypothetical protein [Escherichia coli]
MKPEHFAWKFRFHPNVLLLLSPPLFLSWPAQQIPPSTATARKGFAGYDHPNQYLVKPATTIADNMMPVMQHPAQDKRNPAEAGRT